MIREYLTDRKLIELYATMTGSDFEGNTTDTYLIELMYAMMSTDLVNGDEKVIGNDPMQLLQLSKEVVRIFETDDRTASVWSMANWAKALCLYMKVNSLTYRPIHRMSTVILRKEVSQYLSKEEL